MKTMVIRIDNDKIISEELTDDKFIASRPRYIELLEKEGKLLDVEKAYKEHLDSLKDHTLVKDSTLAHLKEVDTKYNEISYEYSKLKIRYMQENLLKYMGGTPIDWACYNITHYLNYYLEMHDVSKNASLTEKRMHTIAFAHALEDKLLDYINKLEEFNND